MSDEIIVYKTENIVEVIQETNDITVSSFGVQGIPGPTGPAGAQGPSGIIAVNNPIINTGTSSSANLSFSSSPTFSGKVTAASFEGNGSLLTSITGSTVTGSVNSAINASSALFAINSSSAGTALRSDVSEQIHVYAKNTSGSQLYKGQAVYVTGAQGANLEIGLAMANFESTSSKTFGLLLQDLAINAFGYVITTGVLTGIDTSDAINEGDAVWLSPTTAGGKVYGLANKPLAPYHMVYLGVVTRKNQNNGAIFINIQNGFELQELHNVYANNPNNNDVIVYNSSSGLWVKSASAPYATNAGNSITTSQTSFSVLSVTNSASIGGNLSVTGNLFVSGSTASISASNITLNDPLLYLAHNNPANINDIGIIGSFTPGASNTYQHTGFARDASDGYWKLFSNITSEPTSSINFSGVTYDPIVLGRIQGIVSTNLETPYSSQIDLLNISYNTIDAINYNVLNVTTTGITSVVPFSMTTTQEYAASLGPEYLLSIDITGTPYVDYPMGGIQIINSTNFSTNGSYPSLNIYSADNNGNTFINSGYFTVLADSSVLIGAPSANTGLAISRANTVSTANLFSVKANSSAPGFIIDGAGRINFQSQASANTWAATFSFPTSGSGLLLRYAGATPTRNITEWQTSTGSVLASIGPTGNITASGTITAASFIGTSSSANNITGGTAGALLYQSAAGVTTTLPAGSNTFGLIMLGGVPTWTNPSLFTVGNSTNIGITNDAVSATPQNITFSSASSGFSGAKVHVSSLTYTPSTSTLNVGGNIVYNQATTTQSASTYTLALTDSGRFIEMTSASNNTITVPASATVNFPIGTVIDIIRVGSTTVTISPATNVTLNYYSPTSAASCQVRAQWGAVHLVKRAANTWLAFGDIT